MSYNASELVYFCIKYIESKQDVLEGDIIHLKSESECIQNAKDINNWLRSIKCVLGVRKYNLMKLEFENSIMIDVGFICEEPNMNEKWLNIIQEYS